MSKKVKFVLNRKNFQKQVLYGPGTADLLKSMAGPDAVIENSSNSQRGGRIRARVYGTAADEAKNGTLSRALGGMG